jgi:alpha-1,6-mannosyltransferase
VHIVDTTLFFAPHSGGVRRYLLAKNRNLMCRPGVRHTLVVPGERARCHNAVVRELSAPRLPWSGGFRFPVQIRAWARALQATGADVIEAGDPYGPAWAALRAAEELGVPSAIFAHSDLPRLIDFRFGAAAARLAAIYLADLYARFDIVMAPSQTIARGLRSMGLERVVLQPLGVDESVFHPDRRDPALRDWLNLPSCTRLLIFAGRMTREKRIPLLVRAVEGLGAPYHLLLVGGDRRQRVGRHVTVMPFEDDEAQLARLLASSDALVHAGDRETFGLIALEAMACARPVVVVNGGALKEVVDDEVGLVAQANSATSLREHIHDLFRRDPDAMGARARARVERLHTWTRVLTLQLERYALLTHRENVSIAELSRLPGAL